MGTAVVNHHQIPILDFRQCPVNGEFIVILAQRAGYVIDVIAGGIPFSAHRDVMIGSVHGRPHQVGGAGIQPYIMLIGVLVVGGMGNQPAVRAGHPAAKLGFDSHAAFWKNFLVGLANPFPYQGDVRLFLLRPVRNAHAAGKVGEGEGQPGFRSQLLAASKEDLCQCRIISIVNGIGRQERMETKLLCPQGLQSFQSFLQLRIGEAVLRLPRIAHNGAADLEISARVIPAADAFRDTAVLFQNVDMGNIIQIHISPQCPGMVELLIRHGIGRKHNIPTVEAAGICQGQLRIAGAVHTAAFLLEDAQNGRVRQCLDSKIFLKILTPGKSLVQCPGILSNAVLIIKMKRGGVLGRRSFKNFIRQGKIRHTSISDLRL